MAKLNPETKPTLKTSPQNDPESKKEGFHFLLGVDEGSRFRLGMILRAGKKISVSGEFGEIFRRALETPVRQCEIRSRRSFQKWCS